MEAIASARLSACVTTPARCFSSAAAAAADAPVQKSSSLKSSSSLFPCCFPNKLRVSSSTAAAAAGAGRRAPVAMTAALGTDTFEQVQAKLMDKLKDSPELKPVVAQKLAEIAQEINGGAPVTIPKDLPAAERIKQGFLKFKKQHYLKNPELYKTLSAGQSPKFMVIACADSRVCPTTILGLEPGEAFMIRNIASMVPAWGETGNPSTSAALEYAVLHLKVSNILVIGHSKCGGINALMQSTPDNKWSDYIQDWIKVSEPAKAKVVKDHSKLDLAQQCAHCEKESVNVALSNLLTFPWVKEAVVEGRVALHGGHYSFVDGSFEYWTLDVKSSAAHKF